MALDNRYEFTTDNIKRIKAMLAGELKDDPENPIKKCMKLVYESALEKNLERRLELSNELSIFLTKPGGVMNLFLSVIDFDVSSQKFTTLTQRYLSLANIITALPKICMPYEEYCENISNQLISLLVSDNTNYSTLGCIILRSLIESPRSKNKDIDKLLLNTYFDALKKPSALFKPHDAITAIYNLIQNHFSIELFMDVSKHLFYSLVSLDGKPSRLKTLLRSSLVRIIDSIKQGPACCLFDSYLTSRAIVHRYDISTDDKEISITISEETVILSEQLKLGDLKSVILSLLEESKSDLLVLEYFFHFQEVIWTTQDHELRTLSASLIEPLIQEAVDETQSKFDLLVIISNNLDRSLDLISRTLLCYLNLLRYRYDDPIRFSLINPSMLSCLDILDVLIASSAVDHNRFSMICKKCLPVAKKISEKLNELVTSQIHSRELTNRVNSVIESMEKHFIEGQDHYPQVDSNYSGELDSIIKDLNHPLVPCRVHGLVRLKVLIITNETHIVSKIPELYRMIESSLADEEPYVYLACINLVTEMAIRATKDLLPKLTALHSDEDAELQLRMNVGEVLIKVIKQLGKLTPVYAYQVMRTFMNGCKNSQELIRVSSLVNIGEVLHNLGHSMSNYLIEVLACVKRLLNDDSIAVKCACVDLIRQTICGLDRDHVETVQEELKNIYRLLKSIRCRTIDEQLCVQISLALEEIDRLVKELVGLDVIRANDSRMEKNIKLLSLFDR